MGVPTKLNFPNRRTADETMPTGSESPSEALPFAADRIDLDTLPKKRKGTPRAKLMPKDALLLAFIGAFPGSDAATLSMLTHREETPLAAGGTIPSIKGTQNKLRKLRKMEAVEQYRHPATGETLYGITAAGIDFIQAFGYDSSGTSTLHGISLERLSHYRMIALVAAGLASPEGYYCSQLGISPLTFEQLVTEKSMREAFQPVKEQLFEQKKTGKSGDFGRWRNEQLKQAGQQIQEGRYSIADLPSVMPALLTMGQPQREGTRLKAVHQPDLAVINSTSEGKRANFLVEVELTKKSWSDYASILATLKTDLDHGYIYSRAVYFTSHPGVEALLKKVDAAGDLGLFSSGKLLVLPILDRDDNEVRSARRVTIGR